MLSVTTNSAAMTAQRNLSVNSGNASNSIARMSSGSRIVKPSDDASSLAISNKLRADISALEQAGRNASQGSSLLQVANGAYDRIGDMLNRMKVLATQTINGTLGTTERLYAQNEFDNLRTQITNTAAQTRFAGVSLLSGGGGDYLQTGEVVAATGGTGNTADISDLTNAAAGLTTGTNDFFDDTLFTSANQINSGFVNGSIKDVNVKIAGQAYEVSISVGNQTFKGRIDSSNNSTGDLVTLTSTSNSANAIQWEVANDIGTGGALAVSESERSNVEAGLRILTSGATYTAINSDGTAADNGFTGIGGTVGIDQNGTTVPVKAGAGTAAGTYSVQYISTGDETADDATGFSDTAALATTGERRGTGYFLLTDGANSWQVDQEDVQIVGTEGAAGAYGTVTFGNGLQVYVNMDNNNAALANIFDRGTSSTASYRFDVGQGGGVSLNFQVSDKATDQVTIGFSSATASSLGLEGLSVADADSAATASARLDSAINIVNTAQATIGAVQSRFEYIQSTIATTVENVSAARGVFSDVDMAAEMTAFTKSQTLMQASVAMLSQANQMPQQLLRLLQ